MKKISILLTVASLIIANEAFIFGILGKVRDKITGKGGDETNDNCLDKDVDAYLDRILQQVRQQLDDPMRLPPRSHFVELSEGRVWGLSTSARSSKSVVKCFDNDTVIIEGKFSVDKLTGRYTWEKTIGSTKREGFIVIISNDFECTLKLKIPLRKDDEEDLHPTLEDFSINKFKDVKLEMTGLGFLTWSLAKLTTVMSSIFQHALASAIENPMREALEREMREISLT